MNRVRCGGISAGRTLREPVPPVTGPGALPLCAASTAITMAEAFIRHGKLSLARSAAPAMLRTARPGY